MTEESRELGLGSLTPAATRRRWWLIGALLLLGMAPLVYLYAGSAASALAPAAGRRLAAPDFTAPSFTGGDIQLSDFRGQPVVLNFWASWCPPCRAEARDLERGWQVYQDRGVVFLGVDIQDNDPDARAFLKEFGVSYRNVRDATGEITTAYAVDGIPTTFFIDRAGRVMSRRVGPLSEQQLAARVEDLLQ